jgi:hypothetical protein
MNHKIGILLTSRNNYDFMGKKWCKQTLEESDGNIFPVLNIDEDSSAEEKQKGRELCDKYNNMTYMDREEPGMHYNIDSAIRFFGDDVKYIVWFQHDCWPLQKDFFHIFNSIVENGKLDNFGTIGFNSLAQNIFKRDNQHEEIIKEFREGKMPLGVLSRSVLESAGARDLYYCGKKVKNRIGHPVGKDKFSKPCAIAVPVWYAIAVNVSLFKKEIDLDRDMRFFRSWDDIAFQFLNKNIYNIVLPDLYIEHRPDLKKLFGLPALSVKRVKKDDTYHSAVGVGPEAWIKYWGWDFEHPSTFEKVKDKYKDTLLYKFYKYDYTKGPLRSFEI